MIPFGKRKIVAMDIGNVCIRLEPERCFGLFGLKPWTPLPGAFGKACAALELGLIPEAQWLREFEKITEHRFTPAQLVRIFVSMIGPDMPGMEEMIRLLIPRGYRFIFLSNTSALHMHEFARRSRLIHLFTGGVFSFTAHALKPAPAIYEAFERKYGVPFAYFDDGAANVEAAAKRSWNAVLFRTPEDFRRFFFPGLRNSESPAE